MGADEQMYVETYICLPRHATSYILANNFRSEANKVARMQLQERSVNKECDNLAAWPQPRKTPGTKDTSEDSLQPCNMTSKQATLRLPPVAKKPLPKEAASQVGALHASHRRQRQLRTHIADGIDAGHCGTVLVIHLDAAILFQLYSYLHAAAQQYCYHGFQ